MTEAAFAVLTLLVLGWAVISDLLGRMNINGPLFFLVAGYLLANPDWGPLSVDVDTPSVHLVAEVTLALLLFADAARVNVSRLRRDAFLPARLLGSGSHSRFCSGPSLRRGSSTTCPGRWPVSSGRRWRRRMPHSAPR